MELSIKSYRNKIVDYLYVPSFLLEKEEKNDVDIDYPEKEIREQIRQRLAFLKKECEQYYLYGNPNSILHHIYFDLLHNGKDPKTLDELFDMIEALSIDDVESAMKTALRTCIDELEKGKTTQQLDLMALVELSSKNAEQKWYWTLAIRHPKEAVGKMIDIIRQIIPIYDEFYSRVEQEIEQYAETFTLDLLKNFPVVKGLIDYLEKQDTINTFVLAKWQFSLFCIDLKSLVLSVDIEKFLYKKNHIDNDTFIEFLKLLGDETRYAVLQEVIKPNMKTKQIAQQLNITSAAVSFHTQKMVNSQLIVFDITNNDVKYHINKLLFKSFLHKITTDFDLDEKAVE